MYDFPEIRHATDGFWAAIAKRLDDERIAAPATLTREPDLHAIWTSPNLLLAQTCGYPLVTALRHRVTLVTTPCYTAPGCDGPLYRSAVVVRKTDAATHLSDLRGRRCAVNDPASNSGMNLLRAEIAKLAQRPRFFGEIVRTGAHTVSACAVAEGLADVAAIDCITWAHLQRLRPSVTKGLRVLDWTAASPGLPLITSVQTGAATLQTLIRTLKQMTFDRELEPVRAALLLETFVQLPLANYDVILGLGQEAVLAGYPVLN